MSVTQLPFPASPVIAHDWNGDGEIAEHLHGLEGNEWRYLCPDLTHGPCGAEMVAGEAGLVCPKCGCRVTWAQVDADLK